ncbi:hypothetical protein GCM10023091_25360 [Ravibacter arvi]|uniref:Uncharacterized protein n=2 Tax=Ravibacter arvi TaxID=2051041 RepID=A0ABP8M1A2_9BACT
MSGCSKKDEKDDVIPKAKYYVSADVEGESPLLYETDLYVQYDDEILNVGSNSFSIQTYGPDYRKIILSASKPFRGQPEEFEITSAKYQKSRFETFQSGPNPFVNLSTSPNGRVMFTKADDTMAEGTFYFEVYSNDLKKKIKVTNGKFRTRY